MTARVRPTDFSKSVKKVLSNIGTPRALTVWLLYESGEHRQLVQQLLDPHLYADVAKHPWMVRHFAGNCTAKFRLDYAATKLFSKCAGLTTGIDVDAVAYGSADEAELLCKETNQFFQGHAPNSVRSHTVFNVLDRARGIISRILGENPPDDLIPHLVGWSPGRTSSAFGVEITPVDKYKSRLDVTPSALPWAIKLINDSPHWGQAALQADGPASVLPSAFTLVRGNTMTVVPKNAKTSRVICFEPHMNIFLQLAVGGFMRRCMRRAGIDLSDQSINRKRAKLASLHRHLATIDLSMASDTLAASVVYSLLPPAWWRLLNRLRSPETTWPDGSVRRVEKFSSMGNGFTFELESLIFYALASAVSSNVSVYGDDIIVPTENYDLVVDSLSAFGFKVNSAKSFSCGSFRESCGMDAFGGTDCTPFFIRKLPTCVEDVVKVHNALWSWLRRDGFHQVPSRWLTPLRSLRDLCNEIPFGPYGYGDGHLFSNLDEAAPSRASFGLEGWRFRSLTRVYRVNRLGIDRRLEYQVLPGNLYAPMLCSALGPRRTRNTFETLSDRRLFTYKQTLGLAHTWADITWDQWS